MPWNHSFVDNTIISIKKTFLVFLLVIFILAAAGCAQEDDEVKTLIKELEDKGIREHVRIEAAQALGTIGDDRAVEPLIAALADEDPAVRHSAATSLEMLIENNEPAVEPLIATFEGEDLEDLVRHGPTIEPLITALEDKNLKLVARAHLYYIRLGEPGTEKVLIKALEAHGWRRMAENFLTSGNEVLQEAARNWAEDHGYRILSRPGTGGPKWGD